MAPIGASNDQPSVWALAASQGGVVTRSQLLDLGFSAKAIRHRLAKGRLHLLYRGVYAVGRPEVTRPGRRMAAVLACGPGAALSHEAAAQQWAIRPYKPGPIEVSLPAGRRARHPGIVIHRRQNLAADVTRHHGILLTSPVRTLIDLATRLPPRQLEAAINEADKLDLVDPESLRTALEDRAAQPGVAPLRRLLDRRTFTLTDSELERRFLPLARRAGLPRPETGRQLNGFRVDFHWPDLRLVVETDGLRYHRTPAQQARDRLRDQAHAAAGLTPLRFTHAQIRWEPGHVEWTLASVARRLSRRPPR